jgi:CRP-like cAMP-binding protein
VLVPAGATLFREVDSAALYYLISGSVRLEQAGLGAVVVDGGQAVGIMEVLTGVPPRGRAIASTDVLALVIPAADLFHALADEIDLLQSLCAGLLALVRAPTNMPR